MQVLYPYVITDAMLTSSSVAEADYPAWAAATAYAVGARVIRSTTHRIYERLIAGTTSATPELDTVNWLDVGPTSRWAMLDDSVGSYTTGSGSVSCVLAPGGPVNDLVLMGVTGTSYSVTVNGSTVRSGSVPAAASAELGSTLILTGLGAAGAPSIGVTVTGSGTVKIGTLCMGTFYTLGSASKGAQIGMVDYSRKEFDSLGAATLVKRSYSRKITEAFTTTPGNLDTCERLLTALRSKAAIWRSLTWVDATCVYGIGSDWSLALNDGVVNGSVTVKSLAFGL